MQPSITKARQVLLAANRYLNDTKYDLDDAIRIRKVAAAMVKSSETAVLSAAESLSHAKAKYADDKTKPADNYGSPSKALIVSLRLKAMFDVENGFAAVRTAQANLLETETHLHALKENLMTSKLNETRSKALVASLKKQMSQADLMKTVSIKEAIQSQIFEAQRHVFKAAAQVHNDKKEVVALKSIWEKQKQVATIAHELATSYADRKAQLEGKLRKRRASSKLDLTNPNDQLKLEEVAAATEEAEAVKQNATLSETRLMLDKAKISRQTREMKVLISALQKQQNKHQRLFMESRVQFLNTTLLQAWKKMKRDSGNVDIEQLEASVASSEAMNVTKELTEHPFAYNNKTTFSHSAPDAAEIKVSSERKIADHEARKKVLKRMMAETVTQEDKALLAQKLNMIEERIEQEKHKIHEANRQQENSDGTLNGDTNVSPQDAQQKLAQYTLELANLHIKRDEAQSIDVRTNVEKKISNLQHTIEQLKANASGHQQKHTVISESTLARQAGELDNECEQRKLTVSRLRDMWKKAADGSSDSNRLADEVSQAEEESNVKCAHAESAAENLAAVSQTTKLQRIENAAANSEHQEEVAEEHRKEEGVIKQNELSEALETKLTNDNRHVKESAQDADEAYAGYQAAQKRLQDATLVTQEETDAATRETAKLKSKQKILTSLELSKNAKGVAKEEMDAEKAHGNAQDELQHAFEMQAVADQEAKLIAKRMSNLTYSEAEHMRQKLDEKKAEAAEAKEEAVEAEDRAVKLEKSAEVSQGALKDIDTMSGMKQVANKAVNDVEKLEQARQELEAAKKEREDAATAAEKVAKDVTKKEENARRLRLKDQAELLKAQSELENVEGENEAIKRKVQAATRNDLVTDAISNTSTDATNVTSIEQQYTLQKANEELSPDLMKKVLQQQNASMELDKQTSAVEERQDVIEEQTENANAAKESQVRADNLNDDLKFDAAQTMINQDDGRPSDSLKVATAHAAVKAVRDATLSSLDAKKNVDHMLAEQTADPVTLGQPLQDRSTLQLVAG